MPPDIETNGLIILHNNNYTTVQVIKVYGSKIIPNPKFMRGGARRGARGGGQLLLFLLRYKAYSRPTVGSTK